MIVLLYILLSALIISLLSLVGVLTLFFKEKFLNKILLFLVAFSAGALLGGAFLHLLPEAIEGTEQGNVLNIFIFALIGFGFFYVLEDFIKWHHHHSEANCLKENCPVKAKPFSYLILFSDGLHNLIDGLVIAGAFLFSVPAGVSAVVAVALHEIPQELGDFGVLVYGGMKKSKALLFNFFSALLAVLGGLTGYFVAGFLGEKIVYFLPLTAGHFIFIACSDLIPEVKKDFGVLKSLGYFGAFALGILLMLTMKLYMAE